MPRITCVGSDDVTYRDLEVEVGCTLMEAAVEHNIPGVVAECGGSCSCATCHVYVDEKWFGRLESPTSEESDLIEFLDGARPTSRLSCQVLLTEELDGLSLSVPESQG